MLKLLLMSVLFATFLVPAVSGGGKAPRRALKRVVTTMALFMLAYGFFLFFLYERML